MNAFYQCITDFIFVENQPQKADIIFVPGGNYPDAAAHAAALFKAGYAPYVLPSGKYAKMTGHFVMADGYDEYDAANYETEWDFLHEVLRDGGVPETAILKENRAAFTWENAIFSRQVLEENGIKVQKAILCCQAFHARRALMYYQSEFPDVEFVVCPVNTRGIRKEDWFMQEDTADRVLAEVERIGRQFHCMLPLGKREDIGTEAALPQK